MNKKNTIRLTESDLKRVITESVKKVLKEFNISSLYSHRREPEYYITSSKLHILPPINEFITINFGEDMAEDFCNYLYDKNVYKPNVDNIDEESFTIDANDYNKIIECIKQYHNKEIAKAVIDSFDDIVYDYDYDNDDWDVEGDYYDYSDY